MKKGIKILVYFILFLCICAFGFTYYYLYSNKELAGEKITDGLYVYKINFPDENHNMTVYNNAIYYYIESEDKYEFYKVDIYKNEKVKIGEYDSKMGEYQNKESYCYFEKDYIDCSTEDERTLFNYKFKEIYKGEDNTVIPYKKGLINVKDNIVYYKGKEYKKLPRDLSKCNVYGYDAFDNNIYIFFADLEGEDCLLNLEENKCENFKYSSIKKYEDGLYYYNEEKINVLNVETNETKVYDNPVKDGYLTTSQLKDNLLYYFDDDYFKVYNLENGKVSLFDYRINEYSNELILNKNLLYLITGDNVYVLNLDEVSFEEMTTDELDALLNTRLDEKLKHIIEEYNIDIKVKKEANLNFKVFNESTVGEVEYDKINDALDDIEEVLSYLGKDTLKEFTHGEYTGLRVYIVSEIKSDFAMDGEQMRYYDKYAIIANSYGMKRTFCHEMMHALEDAAKTKGKNIFNKWNSYNPKGFKYTNDYDNYSNNYKYTVYDEHTETYFIDNYSEVNELEDKARIFENMCMNTTKEIKKNPKLFEKAKYLRDELIKYYPALKDSPIMKSID